MNQSAANQSDAAIFVALMGAEETMDRKDGLSFAQIGYFAVAATLILGGIAAHFLAQLIPFEWLQHIISEVGVAALIAGILAALVEPFFRNQFARDAFMAAFLMFYRQNLGMKSEKFCGTYLSRKSKFGLLKFNESTTKQFWSRRHLMLSF